MKHLFWKTYQITSITAASENKMTHVHFIRGFTWEVVNKALEFAKEKTEAEKKDWIVKEIKRIY